PVVPGRAHHLRPDPAGSGARRRGDPPAEAAVGPRLGERFEARFRDLGLFLGFGSAAAALFAFDVTLAFGLGAHASVRHRPGRAGPVVRADRAEDDRQDDGQADAKPCDHVTAWNHRTPPRALSRTAGSYDSA